eukprot:TRINITY_DN20365_c0_g1_i1.p1 TRINITY_DN20365_c0_g1~~TRINITY_DN20365_c0_g1_i1.p1  ORF type:complete len:108 (+),score=50.39 TRINITY_DN20365_c0_g1_i1:178-501(+)
MDADKNTFKDEHLSDDKHVALINKLENELKNMQSLIMQLFGLLIVVILGMGTVMIWYNHKSSNKVYSKVQSFDSEFEAEMCALKEPETHVLCVDTGLSSETAKAHRG